MKTLKWKEEKSLMALVFKKRKMEKKNLENYLIVLPKKRKLKNQIKRKKNIKMQKKNIKT